MKNLIYKELRLVISPQTLMFVALSALLLVPSWPYWVALMYCLFSFLITFGVARANKDLEFTAMLPISRKHVVMSKHITVVLVELAQMIFAIPFAIIGSLVLNRTGNLAGVDANITLFGMVFIGYAVYNLIFLPWYFKTGYKTGLAAGIGMIGYGVVMGVCEGLIQGIPTLKYYLDGTDIATLGYQSIVLAIGIIVYVCSLAVSLKLSTKNFEKVNL